MLVTRCLEEIINGALFVEYNPLIHVDNSESLSKVTMLTEKKAHMLTNCGLIRWRKLEKTTNIG